MSRGSDNPAGQALNNDVAFPVEAIRLSFPSEAADLMKRVEESGYEIYAVGGYVRDILLGRCSNDIDFTTNARPAEIEKLFADCQQLLSGEKHGTVAVSFLGKWFEITTYRQDGGYTDCRHPASVSFSDTISEDLSRRDFTINALCFNFKACIDMFDGYSDLHDKLIRCIGDPLVRFKEDALRILRSFRLMAVLGFEMEENTLQAAAASAHLLSLISRERTTVELTKLLQADYAAKALIAMEQSGIFKAFLPEWSPCGERLMEIGDTREALLRAGILFAHQPKAVLDAFIFEKNWRQKIEFLGECAQRGLDICFNIKNELQASKINIKRLLCEYGKDNVELLFSYCNVLIKEKTRQERELASLKIVWETLFSIHINHECYSVKQLKINGNDIKTIFPHIDGIKIGKLLKLLLESVVTEELENEKEVLLQSLQQ